MKIKTWKDLASPDCPLVLDAEHVTQAREIMEWSQAELARRLGVPRSTINRWERRGGRLNRRDSLAIRFAVIYHELTEQAA
jgi:DNA-binding transcriptional regulator YiaG